MPQSTTSSATMKSSLAGSGLPLQTIFEKQHQQQSSPKASKQDYVNGYQQTINGRTMTNMSPATNQATIYSNLQISKNRKQKSMTTSFQKQKQEDEEDTYQGYSQNDFENYIDEDQVKYDEGKPKNKGLITKDAISRIGSKESILGSSERSKQLRNLYVSETFSDHQDQYQSRQESQVIRGGGVAGFRTGGGQTAEGYSRPKTYTSELIQRRNVQNSNQAAKSKSSWNAGVNFAVLDNASRDQTEKMKQSFLADVYKYPSTMQNLDLEPKQAQVSHSIKGRGTPKLDQIKKNIVPEAKISKERSIIFNQVLLLKPRSRQIKLLQSVKRNKMPSNQSFTHGSHNPINTTNYTASTIQLRDYIQMSCDRAKASFEPGSSDYNIKREFDYSPDGGGNHSQNKYALQAMKYQDNIRKLWEISRQQCRPLLASKMSNPGPGAYQPHDDKTIDHQPLLKSGFSFTRDMRVFDKVAKEKLRSAIKNKESDYVRSYADLQLQFTSSTTSNMSPLQQPVSRNNPIGVSPGALDARNSTINSEANQRSSTLREAVKYSFPQETRKANIRQYDYNHVKAWPKCFYQQ